MAKEPLIWIKRIFTAKSAGEKLHTQHKRDIRLNMVFHKGKNRSNYPTETKRGPRAKKYKTTLDQTGFTLPESAPEKSFWREHKVVDIMTLDTQELDNLINDYMKSYQERQIKLNPSWWYPVVNKRKK